MALNTAAECFATHGSRFKLSTKHPIQGPIQYNLTGSGGGSWYVTISGTAMTAQAGVVTDPTCIIQMAASDYVAMHNGTVSTRDLQKAKKIKILKGMKIAVSLINCRTVKVVSHGKS